MPGTGPKVVLPLPFGQNDWYSSPSGRIGAPGVYLAYADGKAVRLYRYGGGSKTLATMVVLVDRVLGLTLAQGSSPRRRC